jgi:eukaryotic-like serine/threonine-protein kinase
MPFASGSRLGSYDILAILGTGGMGEVYRAMDSRLKREVAIKVLPEAFSHDAERVARFEREAQALAALKHPHIGAIYELGESGDSRFLVLELVEGQTLADRLKRGAMTVPEALAVAKPIIDALDAAHEKGIVHRDLKPSNIMLTPDGGAKLLDLGLAKLTAVDTARPGDQSFTHSPTVLASMTGTILGTAAYMSPEQATGKSVDKRTDIWSFGVVLYEMLTGESLFHAETLQETLARVLKDEPDLGRVAVQLRPLLRRCLTRDPRRRLRDIADAALLLDDSPATSETRRVRRWPWLAAAAAFAVIAAVAVWAPWRMPPPEPTATRFVVAPPEGGDFEGSIKLSPDGRKLAFAAIGRDGKRRLWIRDMDSVTARPLPETELQTPFGGAVSWSPNNRFIAFTDGNKLMKADVTSSAPPLPIATIPGLGGETSWNSEGVILVGTITGGPIRRVPEAGGDMTPVTAPKSEGHAFPFFLPDQRHFLYARTEPPGIFVGSLDLKPEDQPSTRLLTSDSQAYYVPSAASGPGWIVFTRDGRLMAQPFDASKLALAGEPLMLAPAVGFVGRRGLFTVSSNGTVAYRAGSELQFTWLDRKGNSLGPVAESSAPSMARVSLDGTYVAFDRVEPTGGVNVWLVELARNVTTRLTFDPARNEFPVWSPDRRRVMFRSNRGGTFDLYEKSVDGTSEDRLVLHTAYEKWPEDWSDDGRYVIYEEIVNGQSDLWLLPMSTRQPVPLTRTPRAPAQLFGGRHAGGRRRLPGDSGRRSAPALATGWTRAGLYRTQSYRVRHRHCPVVRDPYWHAAASVSDARGQRTVHASRHGP